MKIIRNEKLINRNSKIGQYASLAGIVIVLGTMVFAFTALSKPDTANAANQTVLLAILFAGIILSQVSMYLGNRFGRRPRPDEQLDAALKGIPGEYSLYHYITPVAHLLVGPSGLWALIPYHQKGRITYQKNRWKNSGGGFAQSYMRIFGQEGIGRPDLEAESQTALLEKFFKKNLGEGETVPTINTALVFLDPTIEIEAEGAPVPAMQVKKLKEHLRKIAKEKPFPQLELEKIKTVLTKE